MTPTQAQIEAERAVGFREGVEWAKKAAEAGTDFLCPKCGSRGYIKNGATTVTATAEAGLPTADDVKGIMKDDWLHPATIERCAQVAENMNVAGIQIATAIRALKDA